MKKVIEFIAGVLLFPFAVGLAKAYYEIIHAIVYSGDEDGEKLSDRLSRRNQIYAIKENSKHLKHMYFLNLRNRELELEEKGKAEARFIAALESFSEQVVEAFGQQESSDDTADDDSSDIMKDILGQQHLGPQ